MHSTEVSLTGHNERVLSVQTMKHFRFWTSSFRDILYFECHISETLQFLETFHVLNVPFLKHFMFWTLHVWNNLLNFTFLKHSLLCPVTNTENVAYNLLICKDLRYRVIFNSGNNELYKLRIAAPRKVNLQCLIMKSAAIQFKTRSFRRTENRPA